MTEAQLVEFWNSEAPLDQVRATSDFEIAAGFYNHTAVSFKPTSYNGMAIIEAEITSHAADTQGARPFTRKWNLFIGTNADPQAQLPETRLNSSGYSLLKGWAEAVGVPANKQPNATLCAALTGKQWTQKLGLGSKSKKTGKQYTEFRGKAVKVGTVPAKLDSDAARPAVATPAPNGALNPALAGATFGTE